MSWAKELRRGIPPNRDCRIMAGILLPYLLEVNHLECKTRMSTQEMVKFSSESEDHMQSTLVLDAMASRPVKHGYPWGATTMMSTPETVQLSMDSESDEHMQSTLERDMQSMPERDMQSTLELDVRCIRSPEVSHTVQCGLVFQRVEHAKNCWQNIGTRYVKTG